MNLKSFTVERKTDLVTITSRWTNRFRKKAYIRISMTAEPLQSQDDLLFSGDVKDAHGILFGVAQIAWDIGWRPKGLLESVMENIRSYKIKPGTSP